MSTGTAALFGVGFGLGIWLIILGWRGVEFELPARLRRPRAALTPAQRRTLILRAVGALAAGVVVGVVTGWPVGAALATAAAWWLPRLFGKDAAYAAELAKIEAIATWAEQLRDTLVAASGLEQAIDATAATAPAPIRSYVVDLSAQLRAGTDLAAALRSFGDALADPTGDLVVAALLMSATGTARDLHGLLSALAHTARAQASMRLRVAAGRARTRASARLIVAVTLLVAGALVLFNRPYVAPYDTATGQLVLAIVGGIFATAFWWMARLSRMPRPARILAPSNAEPAREEVRR